MGNKPFKIKKRPAAAAATIPTTPPPSPNRPCSPPPGVVVVVDHTPPGEDQYTMVSNELYKTLYAPEKRTVHGTKLV